MAADDELIEGDLQSEQVRMHGANLPLALAGSALGAAATAWASLQRHTGGAPLQWFAAMAALYLLLGALGWAWRRRPAAAATGRWLRWFRASVALHGLAWGSSVAVLLAPGDSEQQSFLVMVLVGVAAGGQTMVVLDVVAAWLFVVPVLLPAVVWLLQLGGALPVATAGLVAIYIALMAVNAHAAYRRERDYFLLRLVDRRHVVMLRQSMAEAEAANQAKSRFVSHMSHELRTPLNAVLGFTQLLLADARRPLSAEHRPWAEEIHRAGDHLLALINDVMDLSLLEAGRLKTSVEPVDTWSLVQSCVRQLQPMARERSISIELGPAPPQGAGASADRTRLRQVVINLLSNAVKYNRHGGRVRIAFNPEADRLRVTFADDGAGLSQAQVQRLFTAFERLDADRQGVDGTGIGLALSRQLMELMHGEIGVDSVEGRGSVFWLRLPRAPLPTDTVAPPTIAPSAAAPAGPSPLRTVLYVDDNPVNRLLMETAFAGRSDVCLLTADLAKAGLALARDRRPDLMLIDIQMPGMDGFELLQQLRLEPVTRHIPAIALSASALPGDVRRGLAAGFADYLSKPVNFEHLFDLIDRTLPPSPGPREAGGSRQPNHRS